MTTLPEWLTVHEGDAPLIVSFRIPAASCRMS